MKVKTKSIIVLMIALFAVLMVGTTKVSAVSVTEDYLQNMLDILPTEIAVDVKETEYEKAREIIDKKVKDIWKEKGIDLAGIGTNIYNNPLYQSVNVADFHKVFISVYPDGDYSKEKQITLKLTYNNSNNYNSKDEQSVKNLSLKTPAYFTIDLNNSNGYEDYYMNSVSDKTIIFDVSAGAGGLEKPLGNILYHGNSFKLGIFKNDILYDVKTVNNAYMVYQIIIPANVSGSEEGCINYAIPVIKNYVKNFDDSINVDSLTVTKGAKLENSNVEIENGYTVKAGNIDLGNIILKKTTSNAVVKEDTTTGIKLETTTAVIPSDVVLSSTKVTEPKILDIVKTSLKDISNKYTVFDINLLQNNVKIQPSGKVKVSIPVPSDYIKEKLVVYRVAENGTKTKYDVKVEGNYATFETDHFSTYVLAEVATENKPTTNNDKKELDETPKTGTIDMIYYILPVTIISALGIVLFKKKQTK